MLAIISGRRVAARMTLVAAIWLNLGLIFAFVFGDPIFVVFGVAGSMGAALSSIVAILGQAEISKRDGSEGERP
jgi:uncharacterized membrane protein